MTPPALRSAPAAASGLASLKALAPGRIICGVDTGNTARRTLGMRSTTEARLEEFSETLDPAVEVDMPNTISVTDERREVQRHIRRFDAMRDSALPPARTAGYLEARAREWT